MIFSDKTAIITGGSAGVGFATAQGFLREGASVVIMSRYTARIEEAKARLEEEFPGKVLAVPGDVSDEKDVKNVFEKAVETFGKVNFVINNAGISLVKKLTETTMDEWNSVMSVNTTGTFLMCREAVGYLLKNKLPGRIVNISSIMGKTGSALGTSYTASKAAVIGFTKAAAKEVAGRGININCICPGAIDTDLLMKGTFGPLAEMFHTDTESLLKRTLDEIPQKRLLDPCEISDLILYLCSEKASGVTGQAWDIACGYNIH